MCNNTKNEEKWDKLENQQNAGAISPNKYCENPLYYGMRGDMNVMPPVFLRPYSYNYNEIYICNGYILYKVEIIFP
jgi:hypothetical protein